MNPEAVTILVSVLQVITTLALVCITFWYARHTKGMLSEMRKSREANVIAKLSASQSILYISIWNIGTSPAKNIHLAGLLDPKSIQFLHKSGEDREPILIDHPLFKEGIEYLAPGVEYKYRFGRLQVEYCKKQKPMVELNITFDSLNQHLENHISYCLYDLMFVLQGSFMQPEEQIVSGIARLSDEIRQLGPHGSSQLMLNMMSGKKRYCEFCGEEIRKSAQKCPHCLEWLGKDQNDEISDDDDQS